ARSAGRRGGDVGEVIEEQRGLSKARGEVLVDHHFGHVVARVLTKTLAVMTALPGIPQGVGARGERENVRQKRIRYPRAISQRCGSAMNPLIERSAGRDDSGSLVPHLTPDPRCRAR